MGKIWMPGGGGGTDLDVITAEAEDVLAGKVIVDKDGEPMTGSMVDQGDWSSSELAAGAAVAIPGGKHSGAGKVTARSLASQTPGTAGAPQILAGQSAWVNGNRVDGAMPNRGGYWGFGNNKGVDAGNQRMWVQVPGGYYDENAQVFLSWADIRNLTGLTPDKIKKGQSIMGIIGSFQGYTDSPLYLYNRGAWNGLQTPGFTAGENLGTSWRTYIEDVCTLQTVNLTPYKYITLCKHTDGTTHDGVLFINTSNTDNSKTVASIKFGSNSTESYVTLDITNYSGFYYIGFFMGFGRAHQGIVSTYGYCHYLQLRDV